MTTVLHRARMAVAWLPIVAASAALAAESASPPSPTVPGSPAFEALDVTPSGILQPASVGEFAANLVGAAGTGRVAGGFALEVSPLWAWKYGRATTLREWRAPGSSARLASWFALSLATAPATDGATRAAFGVRQVFVDTSDPRFDLELEECVSKALGDKPPPPPPDAPGTPQVVVIPALGKCRSDHERRFANGVGDSLVAAAAVTGRMADQLAENLEWDTARLWVAGALSLGRPDDAGARSLQLVGSARYGYSWLLRQHDAVAGVRLRWAGPWWGLSADASWMPEFPESGDAIVDVLTAALGFEVKLSRGFWLTGSPALEVRDGDTDWSGTLGVRLGTRTHPLMNL